MCFYRDPKTKQEIAQNNSDIFKEVINDYGVKIKIRKRILPTSWDDILKSNYRDNSWKRYRNTQYKNKPS